MLDLWYKNAIIYSLDVETFADGNADGIGDFQGLTDRLDYLTGLNVNCLWLLPFYPSPNRDNGYDITDYYGVDPRLGSLGDFVEFTRRARDRGLRVLADLVLNHTSIDHPWFQSARTGRSSPYYDYYVWSNEKPKGIHEGVVFPGVQETVWTYEEQAGAWYFHRFFPHQPDLNIANPAVRNEICKVIGFWLQLGVSGFRVDALPFVIEQKGVPQEQQRPDPYEYLRELSDYLSWRQGDAIILAEANLPPEEVPAYFDHGDKIQLLFNFYANQHLFLALARQDAAELARAYRELPAIPALGQWANFLRNHDELDLGRLSEAEREEAFRAFAPDENMRLYGRGIRRRLAPMLGNDRRRLELAHSLMLTLPGTPVLRYGDEIGMGEDLLLPERDPVRTPMQWSSEPNGGFSDAPADRLVHPVISGGEYGHERVNVAAQLRDPGSMLNWTERTLRARQKCAEFGWGAWHPLDTGDTAVLAHRCEHRGQASIAVHNLTDRRASVTINVGEDVVCLHDLLSSTPEPAHEGGRQRLDLDPYGYRWFRLERRSGSRAEATR